MTTGAQIPYYIYPFLKSRFELTPQEILNISCKHFIVDPNSLCTQSRKHPILFKRYMISAYLREQMEFTFISIGRVFNRDHSSIIHGKNMHDNMIKTDDKYREEYGKYLAYMKHKVK